MHILTDCEQNARLKKDHADACRLQFQQGQAKGREAQGEVDTREMQRLKQKHDVEVQRMRQDVDTAQRASRCLRGELKYMREERAKANAGWGDALKRRDELSKELDSKDKMLEKVQGEAAELEAKYQSVQHDLAAAEQSRESTEERLRAKESEVIVAIVKAHVRSRERICTDSS